MPSAQLDYADRSGPPGSVRSSQAERFDGLSCCLVQYFRQWPQSMQKLSDPLGSFERYCWSTEAIPFGGYSSGSRYRSDRRVLMRHHIRLPPVTPTCEHERHLERGHEAGIQGTDLRSANVDVVEWRRIEGCEEVSPVCCQIVFLGLLTSDQQSVRPAQVILLHHVGDDLPILFPGYPAEGVVRVQDTPCCFSCDPMLLECQAQQLMSEDVKGSGGELQCFAPAFDTERYSCCQEQKLFRRRGEAAKVLARSRSSAGTAYPLEERSRAAETAELNHPIQLAYIDTQLQS